MTKNINFPFIILGHISFLLLLLASLLFYKERILFSDTAFQFFKIVNFEKINIEAYRYGATLPQLPLLIAVKLGIGLKSLIAIYSVSFIMLYYIVFYCSTHLLKNITAGLSIILTLILCTSQSFFHPVTETHQSLVFSVLLFAILQSSDFRNVFLQDLLAIAIILISFFTHPVAIYPIIFIIGYNAIDKKQLHSFKPYLLLFIAFSLALAKVLLTNENSYEGKFFTELMDSPAMLLQLHHMHSTTFFTGRLTGLYLGVAILELILIVILIFQKKYTKLIWQLCILSLFMLVTMLTYHKGDSEILMERAFMPLGLLISIPLLNEFFSNNHPFRLLKLTFLIAVIAVSLNRIHGQGQRFKERTRFNQGILRKTATFPNRKFIVSSSELQKHHYTFWSHSFETLILSSITEEVPTQTIFPANDPNQLKRYTKDTKELLLGTDFWLEWKIDDLNQKYFKLSTEFPYKIINIEKL